MVQRPPHAHTKTPEFEVELDVSLEVQDTSSTAHVTCVYVCGKVKHNYRMPLFHLMLIGSLDKGVHLC